MEAGADRVGGLEVRESEVRFQSGPHVGKRIGGMGLFTTRLLPKCTPVGFFTGRCINVDDWHPDKWGVELRRLDAIVTPLSEGATSPDFQLHPFAASNEPPLHSTSNMCIRSEFHDDGRGMVAMLAFYTTNNVQAGMELTWHYGDAYERDYEVGTCNGKGLPLPRASPERAERLCKERPDGAWCIPDSSDGSDASDSDFTPSRPPRPSPSSSYHLLRRSPRLSHHRP